MGQGAGAGVRHAPHGEKGEYGWECEREYLSIV